MAVKYDSWGNYQQLNTDPTQHARDHYKVFSDWTWLYAHLTNIIQALSQALEAVLEGIEGEPSSRSYADLWAALRRLDRLLERASAAAETIHGPAAAHVPFRGLHIGLDEVASLLERAPCLPLCGATAQVACADQSGEVSHRLAWLDRAYALSPFELDAILICLAPELDLRYWHLYAYVQDDVTKKRPGVDPVLSLLSVDPEARLANRRHFTPNAPLGCHHLIRLAADPSQVQPPMLSHTRKIDERILCFLLGADEIDSQLAPIISFVVPDATLEELWLPPEIGRRLTFLVDGHQTKEWGLLLYFQRPYGVGKQSTVEALCGKLGLGLLVVDGERLLQADDLPFDVTLRLVGRGADLQHARSIGRVSTRCWQTDPRLPTSKRRATPNGMPWCKC